MLKRFIYLFMVLLILGGFVPAYTNADSLDTWSVRSSGGNHLFGISYGNHTFVAVGQYGMVVTSSDGVTWTSQSPVPFIHFYNVIYGNNTFVAVANGGVIMTSLDGTTWSGCTSNTSVNLRAISYGNGKFVAVGVNGTIVTSSDGVNWSPITVTASDLYDVSYVNNIFVAVGYNGAIITSIDGTNWVSQSSGTSNALNSVSYGNGRFVVVGDIGTVRTSIDGQTWTGTSFNPLTVLSDISYNNNIFVAVGHTNIPPPMPGSVGSIFTSIDGITWNSRSSGTSNDLNGISYGNGKFVAVGNGGMIIASSAPPIASSGTLSVTEDTPQTGTFSATDVEGDALTYSVVAQGTKGTVTVTNATYTYTPNANATGTDSFTFKANDGAADSNTATVSVTIIPVNDTPVASSGTLAITEDTPQTSTFSATDVDGDALTYSVVAQGTKGTVTVTNATYTYTPNANATGTDNFTFKANDGTADSNTATVSVTITAVVPAPNGSTTVIANNTRPIISPLPNIILKKDGGIELLVDPTDIVKETRADGTVVEKLVLSEQTINQVLELLKTAAIPLVTIVINDSERVVQVQLPAALLTATVQSFPNTIFEVKLNGASFQLQVSVIDLEGVAKRLGVTLKDLKVNVVMEQVSDQAKQDITKIGASQGIKILGSVLDFKVTAEANGQTAEIRDFGGTYMARAIVLADKTANPNLIAVHYDPATQTFSFIPSTLAVRADGKQEVAMMTPHNSMYTVIDASGRTFADLSGHWAKADVELLASKLIVNGVDDNHFAPDTDITRAEFATLLVHALGLSTELSTAQSVFADVAAGAWYAPEIQAAANAGLVNGVALDRFAPNERITREQMAVMIAKALIVAGKQAGKDHPQATPAITANQGLSNFVDQAAISTWALSAAAQVTDAGIITGMPGHTFTPSEYATRAQATTMLKRFLQVVHFID